MRHIPFFERGPFLFRERKDPNEDCRDIAEDKRDNDIGHCITEELF